jgi:hypothetical protein
MGRGSNGFAKAKTRILADFLPKSLLLYIRCTFLRLQQDPNEADSLKQNADLLGLSLQMTSPNI